VDEGLNFPYWSGLYKHADIAYAFLFFCGLLHFQVDLLFQTALNASIGNPGFNLQQGDEGIIDLIRQISPNVRVKSSILHRSEETPDETRGMICAVARHDN
jgi:hypothetical protein